MTAMKMLQNKWVLMIGMLAVLAAFTGQTLADEHSRGGGDHGWRGGDRGGDHGDRGGHGGYGDRGGYGGYRAVPYYQVYSPYVAYPYPYYCPAPVVVPCPTYYGGGYYGGGVGVSVGGRWGGVTVIVR